MNKKCQFEFAISIQTKTHFLSIYASLEYFLHALILFMQKFIQNSYRIYKITKYAFSIFAKNRKALIIVILLNNCNLQF